MTKAYLSPMRLWPYNSRVFGGLPGHGDAILQYVGA
jgi:hypothetical protein